MTNKNSWYHPKPIKLGAWELIEAINQEIYALAVPQEYIDVAWQLARTPGIMQSPLRMRTLLLQSSKQLALRFIVSMATS